MRIIYSLLIFSFLISCNKPTNSTDNTPIDNSSKDSLNNDVITAGLSNFPNVSIRASFSCCMKATWGDGIISKYSTLSQTIAVEDSTGGIKHDYTYPYSDYSVLQVSGKKITYFLIAGNGADPSQYVISNLDASECPSLNTLYCLSGQTRNINVRNCLNLTTLKCSYNSLDTIYLDMNKDLRYFYCNNNRIYTLDLKNNNKLYDIDCSNNRLTVLTLTNQKLLTTLDCNTNKLVSLNISSSSNLQKIDLSNNNFSDTALNRIFDSLPANNSTNTTFNINIKNNPGSLSCDLTKANGKGWSVYTK